MHKICVEKRQWFHLPISLLQNQSLYNRSPSPARFGSVPDSASSASSAAQLRQLQSQVKQLQLENTTLRRSKSLAANSVPDLTVLNRSFMGENQVCTDTNMYFYFRTTHSNGKVGDVNPYIPTQTLRKIKMTICNHQAECLYTCGPMSALVICKPKTRGHIRIVWVNLEVDLRWIELTNTSLRRVKFLPVNSVASSR